MTIEAISARYNINPAARGNDGFSVEADTKPRNCDNCGESDSLRFILRVFPRAKVVGSHATVICSKCLAALLLSHDVEETNREEEEE